ncbi:MAG: hypothetical protein AB7V77_00980 [Candidatus Woesearchaeota archaeon]
MIEKPKFVGNYKGLAVYSTLRQKIEVPISVDNKSIIAYITYEHETKGTRYVKDSLDINIIDFPLPNQHSGIFAKFECLDKTDFKSSIIKTRKDYYHNEKVAKIFYNSVSPALEERLPEYMVALMNQDRV